LINTNEENKYICYFDASHREENAAIAYIVKNSKNKTILESSKVIKCNVSHIAETRALIKLLGYLSAKNDKDLIPKNSNIIVYGDCKGIIDFVRKRNGYTKRKYKETYNLLIYYYLKLKKDNSVNLQWIRRNKNKEADAIARKLLKECKVA